jgi:hypothetical protein
MANKRIKKRIKLNEPQLPAFIGHHKKEPSHRRDIEFFRRLRSGHSLSLAEYARGRGPEVFITFADESPRKTGRPTIL